MRGYPEVQDELDGQLVVDCTTNTKVRTPFVVALYCAVVLLLVVAAWRTF